MDWIPRTVRQKQKRIEEAIKNIEARTGRAAADEEIAGEIGIAAAELNEWQSQVKVTNVVSLNEFVEQGGEPVMDARGNSHFAQPEDNIEEEELKKVLSETMDLLTEKERKVILLYYYEELTNIIQSIQPSYEKAALERIKTCYLLHHCQQLKK